MYCKMYTSVYKCHVVMTLQLLSVLELLSANWIICCLVLPPPFYLHTNFFQQFQHSLFCFNMLFQSMKKYTVLLAVGGGGEGETAASPSCRDSVFAGRWLEIWFKCQGNIWHCLLMEKPNVSVGTITLLIDWWSCAALYNRSF